MRRFNRMQFDVHWVIIPRNKWKWNQMKNETLKRKRAFEKNRFCCLFLNCKHRKIWYSFPDKWIQWFPKNHFVFIKICINFCTQWFKQFQWYLDNMTQEIHFSQVPRIYSVSLRCFYCVCYVLYIPLFILFF